MKIKESKYQVSYLKEVMEHAKDAVAKGRFAVAKRGLEKLGIASVFSLVVFALGGAYCRSIGLTGLTIPFVAMFTLSFIVLVCWALNSLGDGTYYFSIEDISLEEIRAFNKKKLIAVIEEAVSDLKYYVRQIDEDEKVLSEIKSTMKQLEDVKIIVTNDIAIFVSGDRYYAVHTDDVDFDVNARKNILDFSADDDGIKKDIMVIEQCVERLQNTGKLKK